MKTYTGVPTSAQSQANLASLYATPMLTAFDDGAPIWSTLTLKGTVSNRTPRGAHRILWRVPNETMTSERVYLRRPS